MSDGKDDAKPAEPGRSTPAAEPAKAEAKAKLPVATIVSLLDPPKAPPWWRRLRAEPPSGIRALLGAGAIALIFIVWWIVTRGEPHERIISPSKLPSPGEVFGSIGRVLDQAIGKSIAETLERVFVGVGLAALVGIGVGVLAAANRGVGAALNPLIIFLRSVPMGALIPLTLMLFGDGTRQKPMFLFLALVGFVLSDTVKAIMIVPERYLETAQTLGATRFQIVRKVLVPLALPDIITSLRFQFGLALGYVTLAEAINTQFGLGTMINTSQRLGHSEQVYVLLFIITLIAFSLDLILRTLQRGIFAWRKDL